MIKPNHLEACCIICSGDPLDTLPTLPSFAYKRLISLMEKKMHILTWLKDKWITFWEVTLRVKASLSVSVQNTHKIRIIAVAHALTHQQVVVGMIIAMAQQPTN